MSPQPPQEPQQPSQPTPQPIAPRQPQYPQPQQPQYPHSYPAQPIPQQPPQYPGQPPYPQQPSVFPTQPPYPQQAYPQQVYPQSGYPQQPFYQAPVAPPPQTAPAPTTTNPAHEKTRDPRPFKRLLLVATVTSIASTVAFVLYVLAPRGTAAQLSHAHPYYLAGLIGLAVAEACQILGILVLIGHWASHYNTQRRLGEILILIIALIPYMVLVIFLWTLIAYLRARRQDPASDQTARKKQELKEETVNTLIDAGTNRSSALASSQAPVAPAASTVRATFGDTVGRVIGPSTRRSFSEAGNWLVSFTMIAVVLATVATLAAVSPLSRTTLRKAQPFYPTTAVNPATSPTIASVGSPGNVTQFQLPSSTNLASAIAAGPDGNLWMTRACAPQTQGVNCSGSDVVRVAPSGQVTDFPLPSTGEAEAITAGPDGNLWFGIARETSAGSIGRVTPSGAITEFPLSTNGSANSIAVGPDGALWFTERREKEIGRITTTGQATFYPVPYSITSPHGITAGPDGNLWFTGYSNLGGGVIGRITPSGQFSVFKIPNTGDSYEITKGADGKLWFTDGDALGSIAPDGHFTIYALPDSKSQANSITLGPDGNVWFAACTPVNPTLNADPSADVDGSCTNDIVGSITSGGHVTTYPLPSGTVPVEIVAGPDKNLWITEPFSDVMGRVTSGS